MEVFEVLEKFQQWKIRFLLGWALTCSLTSNLLNLLCNVQVDEVQLDTLQSEILGWRKHNLRVISIHLWAYIFQIVCIREHAINLNLVSSTLKVRFNPLKDITPGGGHWPRKGVWGCAALKTPFSLLSCHSQGSHFKQKSQFTRPAFEKIWKF